MKKRYLVIIILAMILFFGILYYPSLLMLYLKYFSPNTINIFFFNGNNFISNVSVSLYAFYPSSQGTIIQKIYQGNNLKYLLLPNSYLTNITTSWISYYNYSVIPSLIGFALYSVVNSNGSITVYLQPFTISISLYNITHNIGKTIIQKFVTPIKRTIYINKPEMSPQNSSNQNYTVANISLSNYWFYPSENSYGVIPISIGYITSSNYSAYGGILSLGVQSSNNNISDISFGITVLNKSNLIIPGVSLTMNLSNTLLKKYAYFGRWNDSDFQFAEIFAFGQIAIANYTLFIDDIPIDNFIMAFVTGFFISSSSDAYKPQILSTNSPSIFPPTKFFSLTSKNLTFLKTVSGINGYTYYSWNYAVFTPQGYLSGGIPLSLLPKIVQYDKVIIPGWVLNLLFSKEPKVSIAIFTAYPVSFASIFTLASYSKEISFHIYTLYSNYTYDIDGKILYLPFYYYYVNYTN